MDELQKVQTGQPVELKAGTWNAFIDAARAMRNLAANRAVQGQTLDTKPGVLWVRNDSGADITTIGAVLGLDGMLFTPDGKAATALVFKGVTPDKMKHRGKFCVLSGPVGKGKLVEAYVDTVALVRLFVPLEETADRSPFAEIDDGQTRLRAAGYGSARILYRELAYGEMWAVVRLGGPPAVFQVKLEQIGGAQGTSTAAATWTYKVRDAYTDELLSDANVDPTASPHKWKRPAAGQMIKATYGLARFEQEGKPILSWLNEVADQEKC